MRHSGHVWDVPGLPEPLGSHIQWDTRHMSRMYLGFPGLGMGWTVRLELSAVRHSDTFQDVPGLPGTLGWDDWSRLHSGTCPGCPWASRDSGIGWTMGLEPSIELDTWDVSGMFLDFPGLWDGMDSGIGAICRGTLGMYLGCPWASRDSGMRWTVGLEPSALGYSGHVWDVPGMEWTWGLKPSRV